MKSLYELMHGDPRVAQARTDMVLTEEQYRAVVEGAAEIFTEESLRLDGAVPTETLNDPGAITDRQILEVDASDAHVGYDGTGGTFDRLDQAFQDKAILRLWKNWEVPRLELLASQRGGGVGIDVLRSTGRRFGEIIRNKENELIAKGVLGLPGISTAAGIQTFAAGAAWTTAGQAWKDLVKAVDDKLANADVGTSQAALLVNHTDYANLKQVFASTSNFQLEDLRNLLPGGIHRTNTTRLAAGKAYVYAKTKNVVNLRLFEDLSTIALPSVDENPRGRLRLSEVLHIPRPTGIVEITGV